MKWLLNKIILIIVVVFIMALIIFGLIWYSDGFSMAILFYKNNILVITNFLSFIGYGNIIIAVIISLVLLLVFQIIIGRHLTNKKIKILFLVVLEVVGLISTFSILK